MFNNYFVKCGSNLKTDGFNVPNPYEIITLYDTNNKIEDMIDLLHTLARPKRLQPVDIDDGVFINLQKSRIILKNDGLVYISANTKEDIEETAAYLAMAATIELK